jgi:hypothetical protein
MPNEIKSIIRPDGLTDKHLTYLDNLRESGCEHVWSCAIPGKAIPVGHANRPRVCRLLDDHIWR